MIRRLLQVTPIAVLCLVVWPHEADAQLVRADQMRERMRDYFVGEKTQGLLFVGLGAASLAFSAIAIGRGGRALRAMSGPMIAVGAIQLAVGGVVYLRTDAQVAELEAQLEREPAAYALAELERIERVRRWFELYKWVELGLLAGGAAMLAVGARRRQPIVVGIGAGLALQSLLLLMSDVVAAERAASYFRTLGMFRLFALPVFEGESLRGGMLALSFWR